MIIKLKSGKEIYANNGIIGITPKENRGYQLLTEGYDGDIHLTEWKDGIAETNKYTKAELHEIAEIMIKRWDEFRVDVLMNQIPTID